MAITSLPSSGLMCGILSTDGSRQTDLAVPQRARVLSTRREEPLALLDQENAADAEVVGRLCAGDERALELLYDRYSSYIYSLILRIVHNEATAEDVMQAVFLSVWRSADSFRPERGSLRGWIFSIARNLALNEIRRQTSRPVIVDDAAATQAYAILPDSDPQRDPEAMVLLAERAKQVRRALEHLSPEQRTAIYLAYYEGLTQGEIAEALQVPLGTIKARIRSGMKRLRGELRAIGEDAGDGAP